jgi:hypothetical protein
MQHLPQTVSIFLQRFDAQGFINFCDDFNFIADAEPIEEFRLPHVIIEQGGGDCDDIAILCGVFARLKKLEYRFILWGNGEEINHISTEIRGVGHIDPFGKKKNIAMIGEKFHR